MRCWYSGWPGMRVCQVDVMVDHRPKSSLLSPPAWCQKECGSEERVPPKRPRTFTGEAPEGVEG